VYFADNGSDTVAYVSPAGGAVTVTFEFRPTEMRTYQAQVPVRGAAIDLAGPFANLIVGTLACALAFRARRALRLFFALATGFNFLWFALQLVFSVVTRSDDFAWAMQVFRVSEPLRYGLIATGVALYMLSIRIVARAFLPFGPSFRARRIVWTAWLTAGVFACITALFDRNPAAEILRSAAPQSLALSIGLLFLPRYVANAADEPVIQRRISWLIAALTTARAENDSTGLRVCRT